jgi:hypothetical protein
MSCEVGNSLETVSICMQNTAYILLHNTNITGLNELKRTAENTEGKGKKLLCEGVPVLPFSLSN